MVKGHEVLNANHNVYKNEGSPLEVTETQTFYENQYLEVGKTHHLYSISVNVLVFFH
jgi:hypothetical protein